MPPCPRGRWPLKPIRPAECSDFHSTENRMPQREKFCENLEIYSWNLSTCLIYFSIQSSSSNQDLGSTTVHQIQRCPPGRRRTDGVSDYNICCSSASLFSSLIYKVGIKEKESEAEMWQSMSLYRMIDLPFVEKHPPDLESFWHACLSNQSLPKYCVGWGVLKPECSQFSSNT